MLPSPDSLLPPGPTLRPGVKSALLALLITVVLSAIGVGLSFYIAHADTFAVRAIAIAVFWPAMLVILALGDSGLPGLLFHMLAFVAQLLYVLAVVTLIGKVFRA